LIIRLFGFSFSCRKKVSSEFQSGKDLKTIFARETDEEVEKRKQEATIPLDISKRDKPWNILAEYIQTGTFSLHITELTRVLI
jgi:uncharacterized protein YbaP (TraB family)